jgi:hypothetical protein
MCVLVTSSRKIENVFNYCFTTVWLCAFKKLLNLSDSLFFTSNTWVTDKCRELMPVILFGRLKLGGYRFEASSAVREVSSLK